MIARHVGLVAEAARQRAQAVCLQELFYGPYFCAEQETRWYQLTERVPNGPTIGLMQELARTGSYLWCRSARRNKRASTTTRPPSSTPMDGFSPSTGSHTRQRLANLWPSRITFARGGILTGLIGVAIMPWRLLENADRDMGWLIIYSGFLGPIAGIFIADYWVVRRAQLSLPDLYDRDGIYGRWNPRALVALGAGISGALVGLVIPALRPLYFVGFAAAFVVYAVDAAGEGRSAGL